MSAAYQQFNAWARENLGMKEPAARWWHRLDSADREAALKHAGIYFEGMQGHAWDALPEATQEAMRGIYERSRRQLIRLMRQFQGVPL